MGPNQLAYAMLADPAFVKHADLGDFLRQRIAPLALAGGMGLAGGIAGSHPALNPSGYQRVQPQQQVEQPQQPQQYATPATSPSDWWPGFEAERAGHRVDRAVDSAQVRAALAAGGQLEPPVEGFPDSVQPGEHPAAGLAQHAQQLADAAAREPQSRGVGPGKPRPVPSRSNEGSSTEEQRANESNLEEIAKARQKAEAAERETQKKVKKIEGE